MPTFLLRLAAGVLAVLTLIAGGGIALADEETGPDTAACAAAGAAVQKARLILEARTAVDTAAAATKTAADGLTAAKTAALELDPALDVDSVDAVKAAAAWLEAYIADPASPQGEIEQAQAKLDADNALIKAYAAVDAATVATDKAATAYAAAGGDKALQDLALAGGLPQLIVDQQVACRPDPTSSVTPTPSAAPTTAPGGTFSQVGEVPVGGVETGQKD